MPRCGQASRRAKGFSVRSRPIPSGMSSSIALCKWPRFTRSEGSARYQKPVSISESGASRLRGSAVGIGKRSAYHRAGVCRIFLSDKGSQPHCPQVIVALEIEVTVGHNQLRRTKMSDPHEHMQNMTLLNLATCIVIVGAISLDETTRIPAAAVGLRHRDRGGPIAPWRSFVGIHPGRVCG